MKKHIILSLALLCQVLSVAAEDEDKVYISDFSIKVGETKRIALCFDTDRTDITRLQGTVMMPAGLTVQNQSDAAGTYVWITGNDARTGGALMTYNYATGGVQMTYGKFTKGTGAVAYINVMASSSLAENSTITISDFKVMDDKSAYTNITSENCTVSRDASGQGGEQGGEQSGEGEVSFAFSPTNLTLEKGQTATVDVTMTNSIALTGMQAKLTASDGLTITSVNKGSRIVGQFRYNDTKGTMASLGSISGNEGTVFTVGLKVDDDFTGSSATLTISGLNVTSSSAKDFSASDITLNNVTEPVTELTLDESQTLNVNNGWTGNVTLTRTLQTGSYNTFSVPFAIPADKYTDYKLTSVKKLTKSDFDTGVLSLTFENATAIEAGKPYLVKVSENVVNPVFNDVTVSCTAYTTETNYVDFIPTLGKTTIEGDVENILFLGAANTLYHPSAANQQMKGFRAYFLLKGYAAQHARAFRMNFGDGETMGIKAIDNFTISQSDNCYDLSGRKIVKSSNGKMAKGVYIERGKKIVIK